MVEKSKLSPELRPCPLRPYEMACQASWDGEVAVYVKQLMVGNVRLPLCSKAMELLQHYKISMG